MILEPVRFRNVEETRANRGEQKTRCVRDPGVADPVSEQFEETTTLVAGDPEAPLLRDRETGGLPSAPAHPELREPGEFLNAFDSHRAKRRGAETLAQELSLCRSRDFSRYFLGHEKRRPRQALQQVQSRDQQEIDEDARVQDEATKRRSGVFESVESPRPVTGRQ